MAWESRGNRQYYYQKHRVGGKVVNEYLGTGLLAEMTAKRAAIAKAREAAKRAAWQQVCEEQDVIDKQLDDVGNQISNYIGFVKLSVETIALIYCSKY